MAAYRVRGRRSSDRSWDAERVRQLRQHLGLSQRAFSEELNARQQTISEWETGRYRPRGPSARLLSVIAEEAGFAYEARESSGAAEGPLAAAADPGNRPPDAGLPSPDGPPSRERTPRRRSRGEAERA